jgi:channel protein (hemolysin III family)
MMGTETQLYHLPGFHEPFSSVSHLLGAGVFLILGCLLLLRGRSNPGGQIYLGIYVFSLVLLMTIRGSYHMSARGGATHKVIERLDHAAIFLLIAGTATPVHGILFHGCLRWGPLVFIWTAALTGITLKTIFFEYLPEWLGLTLYLMLGWFGLFAVIALGRRHGFTFVKPLLIGGIAYSIGGVIEYSQWFYFVPGVIHSHELFHIAVLMGAFWHWLFIWQFAAGGRFVQEPPAVRGDYDDDYGDRDAPRSGAPGGPAAPSPDTYREGDPGGFKPI